MNVDAAAVRCDSDRELFGKLLEDPSVIRINEKIEKHAEEGVVGVRRRLLATSIRLTRTIANDIHASTDECVEKLGIDIPLELFVYPGPIYNAACFKPEAGRLFVIFSSSLLESFSRAELKFVIGHELGHHVFRHHDIPIGHILRGPHRSDPKLVLTLFAWSRYAEISADRAGAHCAANPLAVATALFKLASGLSKKIIKFNVDDFVAQADAMQTDTPASTRGGPKEDWFSTHPFSPLRVKALQLFNESELAAPGGTSKEDLEIAVHGLMTLMEPSYLEGRTQEAEVMRRALFAAALVIAAIDGEISDAETKAFESLFGKGSYGGNLDIDKLRAELPDRLAKVRQNVGLPQRMQLIHDLCLISKADGKVSSAARGMLDDFSNSLEVPQYIVCHGVESDVILD